MSRHSVMTSLNWRMQLPGQKPAKRVRCTFKSGQIVSKNGCHVFYICFSVGASIYLILNQYIKEANKKKTIFLENPHKKIPLLSLGLPDIKTFWPDDGLPLGTILAWVPRPWKGSPSLTAEPLPNGWMPWNRLGKTKYLYSADMILTLELSSGFSAWKWALLAKHSINQ